MVGTAVCKRAWLDHRCRAGGFTDVMSRRNAQKGNLDSALTKYTRWLKIRDVSLTVLEAKPPKSRCRQGQAPSAGAREGPRCLFPLRGGAGHP